MAGCPGYKISDVPGYELEPVPLALELASRAIEDAYYRVHAFEFYLRSARV